MMSIELNESLLNVYLKKEKAKVILRGHPWIFSGAIASIKHNSNLLNLKTLTSTEKESLSGRLCKIYDSNQRQIAMGYYNPFSSISCRILTLGEKIFETQILVQRIQQAITYRQKSFLNEQTNACRLINSEGDFLPGLILDQYDHGLVLQLLSAGIRRFQDLIIETITAMLKPEFIYEISESRLLAQEGITGRQGILSGKLPAKPLIIRENGLQYSINLALGQKTGFFFDQRDNRRLMASLSAGKDILDCFCYSGAFGIHALANSAKHVIFCDSSNEAMAMVKRNLDLNDLWSPEKCQLLHSNAFAYLRQALEEKRTFDIIILDPPKFSHNQHNVNKASQGYKDINLLALKLLRPEGILITFSCSQIINRDLFQKILFGAASDSGHPVQVLGHLSQSADHPYNIAHQEGHYLKGLILRKS